MSRIGKSPINLPDKVSVTVDKSNVVTVKGPMGELKQAVDKDIIVKVEDGVLTVQRPTEQKRHKALHGLYRSLLSNMIKGVNEGFKVTLEVVGVGYKAVVNGNVLEMSLGYSHPIYFGLPPEIKAAAVTEKGKSPVITLESIDKQLIGHIAAKIKALRKVEPYKGKGIKFVGEAIRRKAGKSASKK